MKKIKKGDIVARNSYGKDILFRVKKIIKLDNKVIVILIGLTERIEADSPIEDLEIVERDIVKRHVELMNSRLNERVRIIESGNERGFGEKSKIKKKILTGKILHIDGDSNIVYMSIYFIKL